MWGFWRGHCLVLGHRAATPGSDVGAIWAEEPIRPDLESVLGLVLWDHPREDLGPWEYPLVSLGSPVRLCPVLQGLFPPEMGTVLHTPVTSSMPLFWRSLEERSPRRAGMSHFPPAMAVPSARDTDGCWGDAGVMPTRVPAAVPCPGQVAEPWHGHRVVAGCVCPCVPCHAGPGAGTSPSPTDPRAGLIGSSLCTSCIYFCAVAAAGCPLLSPPLLSPPWAPPGLYRAPCKVLRLSVTQDPRLSTRIHPGLQTRLLCPRAGLFQYWIFFFLSFYLKWISSHLPRIKLLQILIC